MECGAKSMWHGVVSAYALLGMGGESAHFAGCQPDRGWGAVHSTVPCWHVQGACFANDGVGLGKPYCLRMMLLAAV